MWFQCGFPPGFNVVSHVVSMWFPMWFHCVSHVVSMWFPICFQCGSPCGFNVISHVVSMWFPSWFQCGSHVVSHAVSMWFPGFSMWIPMWFPYGFQGFLAWMLHNRIYSLYAWQPPLQVEVKWSRTSISVYWSMHWLLRSLTFKGSCTQ